MTEEVRVDTVSVAFGSTIALRAVSCRVRSGLTLVRGPNGAGKSTLLGVISGLVRPRAGTVRVLGADPYREPAVHRRIGVAPQSRPPAHLRPLDFVAGAGRRSLDRRAASELGGEELACLGVDPREPRRLGQCPPDLVRLVLIAGALVGDPAVVTLDEPLADLAAGQRERVVHRLQLAATSEQVVLVTSHVLAGLASIADDVIGLRHGRLVAPDALDHPVAIGAR